MNKIILQGNLTRDPDLKYFRDENTFSRVGIAVSHRYSKNKEVDFFNPVAFGKTAETLSKYCKKGNRILIEGRLQTNTYEKDGVKHTGYDVIVDNLYFCESGKKEADKGDSYKPEDMPFDPSDTPF